MISLVTLGTWVVFVASWATKLAQPELDRLTSFWLFSLVAVITGRGVARAIVRRLPAYTQRALVVGAGHVGQLVARKIQQHPEYGIELLGFVDENPRDRRTDVADLPVLGGITDLPELVDAGSDRTGDRRVLRRARHAHDGARPLAPRPRRDGRRRPATLRAGRAERRRPSHRGHAAAHGAARPHLERIPRDQAGDRPRRLLGPPPPDLTALPVRRVPHPPRVRRARLLPPDTARQQHAAVHGAEVPHHDNGGRRVEASRVHREHDDG